MNKLKDLFLIVLVVEIVLAGVNCKVGRPARKTLPLAGYALHEDMKADAPLMYIADTSVRAFGANLQLYEIVLPYVARDTMLCTLIEIGQELLPYYMRLLKDNNKQGIAINLVTDPDPHAVLTSEYMVNITGQRSSFAVIVFWDHSSAARATWIVNSIQCMYGIEVHTTQKYQWDCFPRGVYLLTTQ